MLQNQFFTYCIQTKFNFIFYSRSKKVCLLHQTFIIRLASSSFNQFNFLSTKLKTPESHRNAIGIQYIFPLRKFEASINIILMYQNKLQFKRNRFDQLLVNQVIIIYIFLRNYNIIQKE